MPAANSKLTPAIQAKVIYALENGSTLTHAAAYAGISTMTLNRWMAFGAMRDADPEYVEFRQAADQAMATFAVEMNVSIRKAAQKSWLPAAWWLERRDPASYGQKQVVQVDYGNLSDEELLERAREAGFVPSSLERQRIGEGATEEGVSGTSPLIIEEVPQETPPETEHLGDAGSGESD